MKKRINILLLAGLLFSAVACDDSENNFSESTSTRIEQTLERYKFALQAGKTWVMEYFPDENLGYGGWIYIVEFQDDRMVKAWFEGSTFVEADPLRTESEYRVEFSTGPMLKFATHCISSRFPETTAPATKDGKEITNSRSCRSLRLSMKSFCGALKPATGFA